MPRAIKEARGTIRPDRDGAEGETVEIEAPPQGTTPPPEWLGVEALAEWHRIVPVLEKAHVLSLVDYSQLANYCEAHGLAVKATKQLKREGLTTKRANGSKVANPLVGIAKESRAQALRIAIEFGLTPAGRTRVKPTEEDPNLPEAPKAGGPSDTERFLFNPPPPPLQLVNTAPKAPEPSGEKP